VQGSSMGADPTPATLARHKQNWQRKVRRCINKLREGTEGWSEAQSAGLQSANRLANDVVLLKTLLLQGQPATRALDELERGGEGELAGLRQAALSKLKERAANEAMGVESALEKLEESLGVLRAGQEDLKAEDTLGLEEQVSRRLKSQQPVYWTVAPASYLKKVESVICCYEKEYEAKSAVLSFFQQIAKDLQGDNFVPNQELESKMKVQLVVWMLEPELNFESMQDLEDLYEIEKKLCTKY